MSRHRNVRSMNYSEEYEGFDDVYGHSVEDDHCISPSDAGFLYDRTRCPQMSAFINEDNCIAEENDHRNTKRKQFAKSDLSEIDFDKLRFCVDEIQNVIGDVVSQSTIEEVALSCNFDVTIALDHILNEAERKSFTSKEETSPQMQRKPGNRHKGKMKKIEGSFANGRTGSTALFSGGGDGPENSLQKFLIPKLKRVEVECIEHGVNDLKIFEGANDNYFSSLKMLMDQHRKEVEVESLREPESIILSNSNPSTLAELSECFLSGKNTADLHLPSKEDDSELGLIIPKLQNKDIEKSDNWAIDLSSALKPEVESCIEEPVRYSQSKNTDVSVLSELVLEELCPDYEIDMAEIVDVEIDLHNENSSPFGKILCRRWKGRMLSLSNSRKIVPTRIIPFDFATPSPDDIVKFLRRK